MTEKIKFKKPTDLINWADKYLPPAGIYFVKVDRCATNYDKKGRALPIATVYFTIRRGKYEGMQFERKFNFCAEFESSRIAEWSNFASLCHATRTNIWSVRLKDPVELNTCLSCRNIFVEIEELFVDTRRVAKYWRCDIPASLTCEHGMEKPSKEIIDVEALKGTKKW